MCLPTLSDAVDKVPAMPSVTELNVPSAAPRGIGTAPAAQGGTSTYASAAVMACVGSLPLLLLKRLSVTEADRLTGVPGGTPVSLAPPPRLRPVTSGPAGVT